MSAAEFHRRNQRYLFPPGMTWSTTSIWIVVPVAEGSNPSTHPIDSLWFIDFRNGDIVAYSVACDYFTRLSLGVCLRWYSASFAAADCKSVAATMSYRR